MIINRRELASLHSDRSSRLVLAALEAAVESVMPSALVRRAVKFDKELSVRDIHGRAVRLRKFDHVYVVGAGKATAGMASALHSILHERVTGGAITIPYGIDAKIGGISVTHASHPVPDRSGIEGTKKILKVLKKAGLGDLVFVLISGGGSALMPLPAAGVSLADKQKITNSLLRSGASIHEMNAVRKHLSAVKGGQLLRHVDSACTAISLVLSDVVGDDLQVIASGPTCPDNSTFADALKILKKYGIRKPDAALAHIVSGSKGNVEETPKPRDPVFLRAHNMLIGNNSIACTSAVSYLKKHGVEALYLGSEFDGEARDFGTFLARLASDLGSRPFAIVAGGETTVRLNKSGNGAGGRNQEAALACMMELRRQDIAVAQIGTDGIDGNSDVAGALVSPKTVALAKKMDLKKYLDRHDSYHAFKKLRSLIFTGYTGTNVNDIAIICKAPA
ncbi:MAG TPA: glycerate kinase [Nitrososphaera sp.]|nr:glycerate kinase [Nitrososphaera sp.]